MSRFGRAKQRMDHSAGKRSIMVGVPMYHYPNPNTVAKIIAAITSFREMSGMDIIYFAPTASAAWWARRELVRRFMDAGPSCTHLFMVDDDMDWPEGVEGFNAIAHLLMRKKDFVGALCFKRQMPTLPMVGMETPEGTCSNIMEMGKIEGLEPFLVDFIGFGMVMLSRKCVESVLALCGGNVDAPFASEFNWRQKLPVRGGFSPDPPSYTAAEFQAALDGAFMYGEDYSFCQKARRAGIGIWCDPSFEVLHYGDYAYGVRDFLYQQSKRGKMATVEAPADAPTAP